MSIDYTKIQLSSTASSLKLLAQGSGTFVVPVLGGAGFSNNTAVIAHNFGSDNLLFQVSCIDNILAQQVICPYITSDGRILYSAKLDSANLYIISVSEDASGFGAPARTVSYSYRILIP